MKAIILAAGEGTRMKSRLPKCLHPILGRSMLDTVIQTVQEAGAKELIVVTGHEGQQIREAVKEPVTFVEQKERRGTGHAVMTAAEHIRPEDTALVICGDTPLVTPEAIARLCEQHLKDASAVTVLSTIVDNAFGYGRIARTGGRFPKIVEQKDLTPDQMEIKEINTGIYLFHGRALLEALPLLNTRNAAGEYYLTDTLEIIQANGLKADVYCAPDPEQFMGVNTRVQLARAAEILKRRVNEQFMLAGVTMIDPASVWIERGVVIGEDTLLYPGVILEGATKIGPGCVIGPNTRIVNCEINHDVEISSSVLIDSHVGAFSTVGPFAYLRPHSHVGAHCKIGCFVDVKNATLGDNTKAAHLTYVGDADVGSGVNFGCGTVTVNYDGHKKYRTVIEDNAFIGCNTNLVSPVTVKESAYVAAGSTITEEVPAKALAIARARQINKTGWIHQSQNKTEA
ncbi:MAG: bifunctional UDP-N-acetylglucosamine diphosphorylase/glucosamine-1-phosphate N-acetyltransferase GlmU [Clostridiales bacterium]|nr:bifunctional UDP-N-acetylglucosamine diphosphorylase/glucosamine-1-phosphate N-acetyltransferase GlmU [Clostridiales bacterium]